MQANSKVIWYQQPLGIIAMLIFFFPVGLYLMFKYANWTKKTKLIVTSVVIIFVIIGVSSDKEGPKSTPSTDSSSIATTVSPTPTPKEINYEILRTWDIPNGGYGKVIVISPDNVNEPDMKSLGEKLYADTKKDRNAFIFIYDDKDAGLLRDTITLDSTTEQQDYLFKHNVGEYTRNINSHINELTIMFDGSMGSNRKTITY